MKKLTKEQIAKKLNKVMSPGNMFVWGNDGISLIGKYCSDELREIARVMDEIFKGTAKEQKIDRIKELDIKGFRAKDIKVLYYKIDSDEGYEFSFYIMKDGKDYNFYYGKSDQGAGNWWPDSEDPMYLSPIHEFIPAGFCEKCENIYEYRGTDEEAIELLKECGFTVEHGQDEC